MALTITIPDSTLTALDGRLTHAQLKDLILSFAADLGKANPIHMRYESAETAAESYMQTQMEKPRKAEGITFSKWLIFNAAEPFAGMTAAGRGSPGDFDNWYEEYRRSGGTQARDDVIRECAVQLARDEADEAKEAKSCNLPDEVFEIEYDEDEDAE